MTEQVQQPQQPADEIDLRELFSAIWQGKWIVITTTFIFAVAAVFYALSLPNIYKSEVLLAPVSEESGLKIPGQLGGLAALAGVNLGGKGADKTALTIEILKSREFIGRFIENRNLFVPVMAAEGWIRSENKLVIDPELYDERTMKWVRSVQEPFSEKPSVQETYEAFMALIRISEDSTTGMIRLSIEHYSPVLAKQWIDQLVEAINQEMRDRELAEAQKSIDYLTTQIHQTNIADVRTMLFSLIEEQTKTVMLANVRDEYAFKTIDTAVVPEKKAKPARALILILAVILGGILSTSVVLVRYFAQKN